MLYQEVRYEPKDFSARRPDGNGGWKNKLDGVEHVLYRLPRVLEAARTGGTVYVVEGPKDADTLERLGLVATTNPFGAGNWEDSYSEALRGANVRIVPDNDKAGLDHAEKVAESVRGKAASVRVVGLPGLGEGEDVSDWIDNSGTIEELERLAEDAPEWRPKETTRLRFTTARQIGQESPGETEFIAFPIAVAGAITEITGAAKASGKTTLLTHMSRSVLDGREFLGRPTKKTKLVYLTEQHPSSFKEALGRADLLDREDFVFLTWHDTIGVPWPEVAKQATDEALEIGAGILVVDTLPQFAGLKGDDENKTGPVLEAMRPLQEAAARGLAVIIVRHDRKSGGEVGLSGRGSSAFTGAVDTTVSLRRPGGDSRPTIRKIDALSRFGGVPAQMMIELVDGEYRSLGDETAVAASEARRKLLEAAPRCEEEAATREELFEVTEVGQTTGDKMLKKLVDEGKLKQTGKGAKGSPYRFWRPSPPGEDDDNDRILSFANGDGVVNE